MTVICTPRFSVVTLQYDHLNRLRPRAEVKTHQFQHLYKRPLKTSEAYIKVLANRIGQISFSLKYNLAARKSTACVLPFLNVSTSFTSRCRWRGKYLASGFWFKVLEIRESESLSFDVCFQHA